MKRVLVYHTNLTFPFGGGEYLPLSFVSELQKTCDVTLALNWQSDVSYAAKTLGISIDMERLKVVFLKPKNRFLRKIDSIIPIFVIWKLKKLARSSNVCISTANMVDFGKPAHHFVYLCRTFGDNAFNDFINHTPQKGISHISQKIRTCFAELILRPLLGVRSTRQILADSREHIYPNSHYVETIMREYYGRFNSMVFYPPTLFETSDVSVSNPLKVVYIGRLEPEKCIVELIDIIEKTRTATGLNIIFHLAGCLNHATPYGEKLCGMMENRDWLKFVGPLYGKEKEDFLLSGSYALHAERCEPFGIAIVEYIKAGIITLVPDGGGTCEIVDNPNLSYKTTDQAVGILSRLILDESFRKEQYYRSTKRADFFSSEFYLKRQQGLLLKIITEN